MEATVIGTRISSSGQTTVPSSIRNALQVGIGGTIYWCAGERETARVSSKPSLASPPHSADASPSAKPCATGDRLHLSGECVKDAAFLGALDVPGVAAHAPEASGPSEWPSSFWATLGALDDPSFVVPPELDYADDAARLSFD